MRYVAICLAALIIAAGYAWWASDDADWKFSETQIAMLPTVGQRVVLASYRPKPPGPEPADATATPPPPQPLPKSAVRPPSSSPSVPGGGEAGAPGPDNDLVGDSGRLHHIMRGDPPIFVPPSPAPAVSPARAPPILDPHPAQQVRMQEAVYKQAEQARVTVKAPKTLVVGVPAKMELFVQQGSGEEAVALAGGATAVVNMTVPVASTVTAHADARTSNLDIGRVPDIPATQYVSYGAPTRWAWKLDPKDSGQAEILVTLNHKISIDGKEQDVPIKYFPYTIAIEVHSWNLIRDWIASGTNNINLLIGFFAAATTLFAIFRPRPAAPPK